MDEPVEKTDVELSAHARREHEKHERDNAQKKRNESADQKQARKNLIWVGVSMVVLIFFAGGIMYLFKHKPTTYTQGEVHWHALIDIEICGQHRDLPRADKPLNPALGGESFKGISILHTHDDNILHIEGKVFNKEDIAFGKFMDAIGVPFSSTTIMEKKNGDLCDGKPSVLKMYVNGVPREDFRDYTPIAVADDRKQVIKLVFGPEETSVSAAAPVSNASASPSNVTSADSLLDANKSDTIMSEIVPSKNDSANGSRLMANASNATPADNV